ncbi:Asp23/Gls24 family envelope stress response protein [Gemella sp. GH3]|uniref:Asp23/Gls24 family envelope stress response protein n=1 Tax=unclassified Gemella TaxID=2624949 RepID=UPI0015D0120E|nr:MULTISPECIES: Asp23/Gls24 family envelope stress response protein [unclassified Gemella]MBF0713991.1 Asp23/Gls24 family envelope stress response protein [Gemella sp. GH3.1]NYS50943.1 Asp23/Gls24 family envelope stress response protein [Gemella sp. GH3]
MALEIKNNYGTILITDDVIASVAGGAAVSCYGIVGMASKNQVKDGITDILKKENYSKGIIVNRKDNNVIIDLHIIVMYGTKISAIASNVQSTVKYQIEKTLGMEVDGINIHIQGIKVVNN